MTTRAPITLPVQTARERRLRRLAGQARSLPWQISGARTEIAKGFGTQVARAGARILGGKEPEAPRGTWRGTEFIPYGPQPTPPNPLSRFLERTEQSRTPLEAAGRFAAGFVGAP